VLHAGHETAPADLNVGQGAEAVELRLEEPGWSKAAGTRIAVKGVPQGRDITGKIYQIGTARSVLDVAYNSIAASGEICPTKTWYSGPFRKHAKSLR
jgi:hypothetical protein